MISFSITQHFNVSAATLFKAWLDSDIHSAMTGGEAQCSDQVGGKFSAWDGYISGVNSALITNQKIIQEWRTTEFKNDDENSILRIKLEEVNNGCELILTHNKIPNGQPDYKQGWIAHYFEPMKAYFK